MKIYFDKLNKTQGIIKISVSKADFQPTVNQKIKEYSRTAAIKGFRKGKVSPAMIQRLYGTSFIKNEIKQMISDKLNAYLTEGDNGIQFFGTPTLEEKENMYEWNHQDTFEFHYRIGYAPPFELALNKETKICKYFVKITNEVINKNIKNFQEHFGKLEHAKVATEGDRLYGHATSSEHNNISQDINIGIRNVKPPMREQLIGIKIDDEVELNVQNDFKNKNAIRNQFAEITDEAFEQLEKITLKIKEIHHLKEAPINQALFDQVFGKGVVKTEAESRERIRKIIAGNHDRESNYLLDLQLIDMLREKVKKALPDTFSEENLHIVNEEEVSKEDIRKWHRSYNRELPWQLISNKIAKEQQIKIAHEEVVTYVKELTIREYPDLATPKIDDPNPLDTFVKNHLQDKYEYARAYNQIEKKKVLDFIKGQITIQEKEISLNEFEKLIANQ